jgi:hypothetical protein
MTVLLLVLWRYSCGHTASLISFSLLASYTLSCWGQWSGILFIDFVFRKAICLERNSSTRPSSVTSVSEPAAGCIMDSTMALGVARGRYDLFRAQAEYAWEFADRAGLQSYLSCRNGMCLWRWLR